MMLVVMLVVTLVVTLAVTLAVSAVQVTNCRPSIPSQCPCAAATGASLTPG